jgi:lysophospholipase L1-like esterase
VKRLLVVVLVGAVFVAAAVVVRTVAFDKTGSSSRVAVVGDSIVFTASQEIAIAFKGRYRPDIEAGIGQRIDQMLPTLRNALRSDLFAVVVDLGTNDVLHAETHPDWRSGFSHMVEALTPARCVVLTTISTLVDGPTAAPGVASEINRAIAEAISEHRNFHVVDWDAAVHRSNGATLLNADKVHPSPAGQVALAVMLRAALDQHCRDT